MPKKAGLSVAKAQTAILNFSGIKRIDERQDTATTVTDEFQTFSHKKDKAVVNINVQIRL